MLQLLDSFTSHDSQLRKKNKLQRFFNEHVITILRVVIAKPNPPPVRNK